MTEVLMPKATAVWLVDNTMLTFDQIATFCNLHALEVQGIADGEVATGIKAVDPIATGQLTQDEIDRCANDAAQRLRRSDARLRETQRRSKGPRYTPLSRRQDRPNAIAWLVRYHPELTDAQVSKLVGTTKQTIAAVRDRTHWNISNITPQDPVTLGLSSQVDLDGAVQKAQDKLEKQQAKAEKELAKKRAANLSAAEASGQPSAQADGVDEDLAATAAEMALVVEPAPESEVAAEPSADNIFGETPEPDAEPEEASPSAEDVFGN
ncbi:MAG: DUF1013 domain-containing protein [Rhodospirillaceae bacterium]|jgi:hypothetical protein|nr:DUF1013 domain-containing protein [Rhodospirillaceae bacterium]MBT4044491.1 DUF1013 domain-containing protein [Rhodospirillaceae bacterium]MBT4686559.1 DUF1013 domain-containing protein [Rhodospirillaceae bacterium]MBT5083629.1 DUF1013 domain-containing protein [Rhodospirillaceae bacterium]MBT5525454.1 DUF1013 domain-containing protein [Rhodospirillaceae bacterium]